MCVWNCAEWCAVSRYALGVVAEHFANIMIASAASCEQWLWRSHITLNTEDLLRLGIQKAVGRPWTIYDNLMFLYQGQVGPRDSQLVCQSTLLWGIQQLLLGFEQTSTWPMAQSSTEAKGCEWKAWKVHWRVKKKWRKCSSASHLPLPTVECFAGFAWQEANGYNSHKEVTLRQESSWDMEVPKDCEGNWSSNS